MWPTVIVSSLFCLLRLVCPVDATNGNNLFTIKKNFVFIV